MQQKSQQAQVYSIDYPAVNQPGVRKKGPSSAGFTSNNLLPILPTQDAVQT